jgi:MarR family transcriptional regulator, 2-MHQ and catechol-resistance regulon repressor
MPTHYNGSLQEQLALTSFIKLTRATSSLMTRLNQRKLMGGLTPSQFGVLETLYHLGPLRQGEISNKLLLSNGNMTLVIDNLEKQGLAKRERELVDRRSITIYLTEAGKELIGRLFPSYAAAITEEMNRLSPEEQEMLGRLCCALGKKEIK